MAVKKVSISLPEETYHLAKKKAESVGATFSGFVKLSIQQRLENGTDRNQ